jgi:DNA-binding transcriptional LysR family regulator
MAAVGVGVGIVPEATARRQRRGLPLAIVRLAEPWANRQLMLCVRDSRRLSRPANKLFDALCKHPS